MENIKLKIPINIEKDVLEDFRILRTKLELINEKHKTISIVSSLNNEGKTTIALNLSRSLSYIDKKVIFVDCDLRASHLAKTNDIPNISDIRSYLAGEKDVEDIIYRSEKKDLDFILCTDFSSQSTELLSSVKFKDLLIKLKEMYDYIILDTSSMEKNIDATIVARESDGTIFVIEQNRPLKKTADKNLEQLKDAKCNVIGVVLNKNI